jgi:hypothetical protein
MIQTKLAFQYEDVGVNVAKIMTEAVNYVADKEGTTFTILDWAVADDGSRILYKTRYPRRTNAELDALDVYIESNNDFTGLTVTEANWAKIKIALYLDTQIALSANGDTIYKLKPADWEFTL